MERFGNDLQKIWEGNGKKFILDEKRSQFRNTDPDVLEYIHDCGYVHCDVTSSISDWRAVGVYKPDVPHPKKAHDGTIECNSRDAHVGKFSRRRNLEILAYNMLQWSCGKLPWEKDPRKTEAVKTIKNK
uniref:Uncharacterized protein n=1 Tax=Strigamia maritima TaxID=126957 RepID=T1JGS6_STRMM